MPQVDSSGPLLPIAAIGGNPFPPLPPPQKYQCISAEERVQAYAMKRLTNFSPPSAYYCCCVCDTTYHIHNLAHTRLQSNLRTSQGTFWPTASLDCDFAYLGDAFES